MSVKTKRSTTLHESQKILRNVFSAGLAGVLIFAFAFPPAVLAESGLEFESEVEPTSEFEPEAELGLGSEFEIESTPASVPDAIKVFASESGSDTAESSTTSGETPNTNVGNIATNAANANPKLTSIAGATRYETAVAIAKAAYPNGVESKTAIIANTLDGGWADSLASSSLAGALDCPILFVSKDELPTSTSEVLTSLGIANVFVIGGTEAISSSVEKAISNSGCAVTRLAGETRFETQYEIYKHGVANNYWDANRAIVATGLNFADALASSPIAFNGKIPILLSYADGSLLAGQADALKTSTVKQITIVGGPAAVPESAENSLKDIVLSNASGSNAASEADKNSIITRLSGAERYDTSAKIAEWGVDNGFLVWDNTAFASGLSSADALSGGVLQGKVGAPVLLVDYNADAATEAVSQKGISYAKVFGGISAVSQSTRNHIAYGLGWKLSDIQGFKVYIDAGHGQNNTGNGKFDTGANSPDWNGDGARDYREADLTKELATMIANDLTNRGIDTFLNDDGGPYYYRHGEAVANGCNVIVSIHFNSGGTLATGVESLIHNSHADKYSGRIQHVLHAYLTSVMCTINGDQTGLVDRGEKTQAVHILSGELPATLLEICFINSQYDIGVYNARKTLLASSIAAGIATL